jgi:hypothetical protein
MIFEEVEGQGSQLDQLVVTMEQCLEGPVTEKVIQEFSEKEDLGKKQIKELELRSIPFKERYPYLSDSRRVTDECCGPVGP